MDTQHPDREDVLSMARLAGLRLDSLQEAELLDAYRHVRRLVTLLPQARSRGDEPAHVFDAARFWPARD